jgi:hypothetical protein
MPERARLRQKAELYRRLASVPTTGGHDEDRVLLAIADDLEHKAATLDAQAMQQGHVTPAPSLTRRGGGSIHGR